MAQEGSEGWQVEMRKRLTGKLKGQLYKVFVSPTGTKFYSLTKAKEAGLKGKSIPDGRTKKAKKKAKN